MKKIRALIVDDEPIAREGLRILLSAEPAIEIVSECRNGREAVKAVREHSPDLLFLDVQMPGMDGFEVIKQIGIDRMPAVVFVTAYDQYAIKAFEIDAMDYLLKPFDEERFQKTLDRVKKYFERGDFQILNTRLTALINRIDRNDSKTQEKIGRLVIKNAGRIFFINSDEIDWIEASGNYVKLHVGDKAHLLRETMDAMAEGLPPDKFLRIRRSVIVNIDRIKELRPLFKGEYQIILTDGTELTSSRRFRDHLNPLLGDSD